MFTYDEVALLILAHFPQQEQIPSFWDSLKHLQIITDIEKKLNFKFSLQEIIETHNNLPLLIKTIMEKSWL